MPGGGGEPAGVGPAVPAAAPAAGQPGEDAELPPPADRGPPLPPRHAPRQQARPAGSPAGHSGRAAQGMYTAKKVNDFPGQGEFDL